MAAAQQLQHQFSLEERIFMVVTFGSTWSQAETIRSHLPSRHTITYNYEKYVKFVEMLAIVVAPEQLEAQLNLISKCYCFVLMDAYLSMISQGYEKFKMYFILI